LWPEEYAALSALLRYPGDVLVLLEEANQEDFDKKRIKEVAKDLQRKERILQKLGRELGTNKQWLWGKNDLNPVDPGRLSMGLSPVETWGHFSGLGDSLIHPNSEYRVPPELLERLNYHEPDRVMRGREDTILHAAAQNEPEYLEIDEHPPQILPNELETVLAIDEDKELDPTTEMTESSRVEPNKEAPIGPKEPKETPAANTGCEADQSPDDMKMSEHTRSKSWDMSGEKSKANIPSDTSPARPTPLRWGNFPNRSEKRS
jgi:hypothetical protein